MPPYGSVHTVHATIRQRAHPREARFLVAEPDSGSYRLSAVVKGQKVWVALPSTSHPDTYSALRVGAWLREEEAGLGEQEQRLRSFAWMADRDGVLVGVRRRPVPTLPLLRVPTKSKQQCPSRTHCSPHAAPACSSRSAGVDPEGQGVGGRCCSAMVEACAESVRGPAGQIIVVMKL
eukprot:1325370-Rhodomonas_salina.1